MAASNEEIATEFPVLGIRVYKSGNVVRERGDEFIPSSLDPASPVQSRDVVINNDTNLSARIYLPKNPEHKLPLLVYFHGGGFCIESAFSSAYHPFCLSFAESANVVIVSVNYRLAPENPIPVPYEDSWEAIKWVLSKNDAWLREHVDFCRVFFGGDSAGGNLAHHMAIRVGSEGMPEFRLAGIVLIHPYFWGKEPVEGESDENFGRFVESLWLFACPDSTGLGVDNPLMNPNVDPKYSGLGCGRVLVCVAENDKLRARGWDYYKKLRASEWKGEAEILETKGEGHVFYLHDLNSESTKDLMKRVGSFLNHG